MRILLVQESDYQARGPHQQHHLLERLQARGYSIKVVDYDIDWREKIAHGIFSPSRRYVSRNKSERGGGIEVFRPAILRAPLLCYLSSALSGFIHIIRLMKSFRPDVILGMGILNTTIAGLLSRFYETPFLLYLIDSLHSLVPERYFRPVAELLEVLSIRMSDRVLVINRTLGEYVKRLDPSTSPLIVSAGVDRNRFHPSLTGVQVRDQLGISGRDFVLFFMGWLYAFSGLRVVAQYILDHPSSGLKLLVLGRGDLHKELSEMADSQKGRGLVKVVSWVPYCDVPSYIAAADVCILPAELNDVMRDIVPIKIYEYLASGKPVLTTRLPGILRDFGHSSGILYASSPMDVGAMAVKLKQDRALYDHLVGEAAGVAQGLDWNLIVADFERILLEVSDAKSLTTATGAPEKRKAREAFL